MTERSPAALQRRFTAALGAAVLLCALFTVLLSSSLPASVRATLSGVGLLVGGVAIVISGTLCVRRGRGRRRRAWVLMTSAAAMGLISNVWTTLEHVDPVKDPSLVAEGSIALAMLFSIVGILTLPAVRYRREELVLMFLDGLVMGGAVLVIVSIVVYSQILDSNTGTLAARAATLVFPLLDVALATVSLLLIMRSQGNRWPFFLLGSGFLLYAVADLAFAVEAAQGEFAFGSVQDMGWIAGYFLFTAAAWHPDASSTPHDRPAQSTSDVRGTLLVFCVLLSALAVQLLYPQNETLTRTQTILWLLFVFAVGIRQTLLTGDNARLRQGLEQRVREQTADLRRMARNTETLLTSVGDGIYGVDLDGRITFINPSGAAALGYSSAELLGQHAHRMFHAPQADGTPFAWTGCYVTEAIQQGTLSSAEEDTYLRADGSEFPVEITSSPLVDDDIITGAVVVFRDVTQRREVDRMKNEFLSVVSHELRTPLTSIRGSLGIIASGALVELTPQAERMVTIAVESSDRLTRLINDILDIERIQSGKLPMSLVPVEAASLLEATATEMNGFAQTAGVRLVVGNATGAVLADADRVVQTLTNLVGNAIKFSPAGGVVRLEAAASDDRVTFSVHDQGRGIPEEKLLAVFEPFEQVDSSDARQKGGTGLGLAISRGIVERHGGRIWAESVAGRGATVRFFLPRASEVGGSVEESAPGAPVVLVCDDDPATVETFCAMLSQHGYRPVGVTDGRHAVERAEASRPAAVLLDMVMPGTSGAQVLAELKASERTRQIPVLVVSGLEPDGDPAVLDSAEAWLTKPVTEPGLITAVAAAIDGRGRDATVLIVEDDLDLAHVLKALLVSHGLNVVHVSTVASGVQRARELKPQVVVLDLGLPDGDGSDVVDQLRDDPQLQATAVVVYSAADVLVDPAERFGRFPAVFMTKSRVTPEELEDRVLELIDTAIGTGVDKAIDTGSDTGIGTEVDTGEGTGNGQVGGREIDNGTGRGMGGDLEGAAAIGI